MIANWWEERELKDATGVGRATHQNHLPKKREELFTNPPEELPKLGFVTSTDDTHERTLGRRHNDIPQTENWNYGKSKPY